MAGIWSDDVEVVQETVEVDVPGAVPHFPSPTEAAVSNSFAQHDSEGPVDPLARMAQQRRKSNALLLLQRWWRRKKDPLAMIRRRFFFSCSLGLVSGVEACIRAGIDLNLLDDTDTRKRTGLAQASSHGHLAVVRLLLEHGAQAVVQDIKGNTALHFACQNTPAVIDQEYRAQQEAERQKAAEAEAAAAGGGGNGKVPEAHSWKASYTVGDAPPGCFECARLLIRKQPKVTNVVNNDGQSALHLAASAGLAEIVGMLCMEKLDINLCDNLNRAPIHLATWRGDLDVTNILLEHGANFRLRNKIGRTPLHVAACYGHTKVCEALVDAGAPLDVINFNGNTPLHMACLDGFDDTAAMLVQRGASTHVCNFLGQSPLRIAVDSEMVRKTGLASVMLDQMRQTETGGATLYGDISMTTYNMAGLDCIPQRHCFGVDVPGTGEVHPNSKVAITHAESVEALTSRKAAADIDDNLSHISGHSSSTRSVGRESAAVSPAPAGIAGGTVTAQVSKKSSFRDKRVHVLTSSKSFFGVAPPSTPTGFIRPSLSPTGSTSVTTTMSTGTPGDAVFPAATTSNHTPTNPKSRTSRLATALRQSFVRTPKHGTGMWQGDGSRSGSEEGIPPIDALPCNVVSRHTQAAWRKHESVMLANKRPASPRTRSKDGDAHWDETVLNRIIRTQNRQLTSHPVICEVFDLKWTNFARRVFLRNVCIHCAVAVIYLLGTLAWSGGPVEGDDGEYWGLTDRSFESRGGLLQSICVWFICLYFMGKTVLCLRNLMRELSSLHEGASKLAVLARKDFWWWYDQCHAFVVMVVTVFHGIDMSEDTSKVIWEPARIFDSLLAAMMWAKFLEFMSAHRRTGPFVKIISVMFKRDIRNFMTVYVVFLLAFTHAFYVLLVDRTKDFQGEDPRFDNVFVTGLMVFRLMVGDFESTFEKFSTHDSLAVLLVTTVLYILYMTLATVLMLNLLIAMLDDTWSRHKQDMEKEWRFEFASRILAIEEGIISSSPHMERAVAVPLILEVPETTARRRKDESVAETLVELRETIGQLQKTVTTSTNYMVSRIEALSAEQRKVVRKMQLGVAGSPSQQKQSTRSLLLTHQNSRENSGSHIKLNTPKLNMRSPGGSGGSSSHVGNGAEQSSPKSMSPTQQVPVSLYLGGSSDGMVRKGGNGRPS